MLELQCQYFWSLPLDEIWGHFFVTYFIFKWGNNLTNEH